MAERCSQVGAFGGLSFGVYEACKEGGQGGS